MPRSVGAGTFAKRCCPDVMSHHRASPDPIKSTCLAFWLAALAIGGCNTQGPKHAVAGAADVSSEPTVLTDAQKRRDAARSPRIAGLLGASKNFGAVLSPDGTKVLFLS